MAPHTLHRSEHVFTYPTRKPSLRACRASSPSLSVPVLAKESFEGQTGKPGSPGPLFIMMFVEKFSDADLDDTACGLSGGTAR